MCKKRNSREVTREKISYFNFLELFCSLGYKLLRNKPVKFKELFFSAHIPSFKLFHSFLFVICFRYEVIFMLFLIYYIYTYIYIHLYTLLYRPTTFTDSDVPSALQAHLRTPSDISRVYAKV